MNSFLALLDLPCRIGFSLVAEAGAPPHCSMRATHTPASLCTGFSWCRAQSSGTRASVVVAPGSRAQAQHLGHTGLVAVWHVGSSRIEPGSPALAGRFFTTEPPGNPGISCF